MLSGASGPGLGLASLHFPPPLIDLIQSEAEDTVVERSFWTALNLPS